MAVRMVNRELFDMRIRLESIYRLLSMRIDDGRNSKRSAVFSCIGMSFFKHTNQTFRLKPTVILVFNELMIDDLCSISDELVSGGWVTNRQLEISLQYSMNMVLSMSGCQAIELMNAASIWAMIIHGRLSMIRLAEYSMPIDAFKHYRYDRWVGRGKLWFRWPKSHFFQSQFRQFGGVIHDEQRVHRLDHIEPMTTIVTDQCEYVVNNVVLCVGSWLHELMPNLPIKTEVSIHCLVP